MKALVGAFNQEKALVGAFSVIVQPFVEPMEPYTALVLDVLGNCGVIHLLSSDTVHCPDDHKVLRQNVSANSFCE